MTIVRHVFIREYLKELESYNACIFAGAGLSAPAGFVNWRDLLREICDEIGLDVDKETDLVAIAQYHVNKYAGNRDKINQAIIDNFARYVDPTINHKILARLPIQIYWTTNYDKLIEKSVENIGRIPDVKYTAEHLLVNKPGRDAVVYKMHGDCDHPSKAVLTRDDYEKYHLEMNDYLSALKGDLLSKTFLFLGFSFTDPNIEYILSRVRVAYSPNQRRHYCIMKRIRSDGTPEGDYNEIKQELFIEDLKNYGVLTLRVDDYSHITDILSEIEQLYKQRSIFISGSAANYDNGGVFNQKTAKEFIHDLSAKLIHNNIKLVNGFGLGVGEYVINGALSEIYSGKKNSIENQLVMRPFPQHPSGTKDLAALWQEYRQDMISKAGIAIFLFGNKEVDGAVVNAGGVRKEFDLAKVNNLKILPVGATGFMAAELWEEVNKNYDHFFSSQTPKFKEHFDKIGNSQNQPNDIIESLIAMVTELNRR